MISGGVPTPVGWGGDAGGVRCREWLPVVGEGPHGRGNPGTEGIARLVYNPDTNLLEQVTTPAGLETTIRWDQIPGAPGVWHVERVHTTDTNTGDVVTVREFDPNPDGNGVIVSLVPPCSRVRMRCLMPVVSTRMPQGYRMGSRGVIHVNSAHVMTRRDTFVPTGVGNGSTSHGCGWERGSAFPGVHLPG